MKYKIAVSGSAETEVCPACSLGLAREVGREVVKQDCILITGATIGVPYEAAVGAKEAKGISIGFSPAASELSHRKSYKLPIDKFDVIVYTGFDYPGRNLLMTRAADGVIIICGRMGTLNEFSVAFENKKPIGVLEGSGGMADKVREIIKGPLKGKQRIIYDTDPKRLVQRLIKLMKEKKKDDF
ncbi:MAG: hypothetical protein ABH919_04065 [bacterium]